MKCSILLITQNELITDIIVRLLASTSRLLACGVVIIKWIGIIDLHDIFD